MDDNFPYLFAAFAVIWVVVLGYVFGMYNRQKQLQREIDLLKQELHEQEVDLPGEPPG